VSTTLPAAASLMSEVIAANSPVRQLLSFSDQVGAIYGLKGFTEANVVTNDKFVRDACGIPLHAFLLAAPIDLADRESAGRIDIDDEEVILLRVTGNASLPQENDLKYLRATAGLDLVVEDGRETPRPRTALVDELTENLMQTAGLTCAILGTFYDEDTPNGVRLAFGSDIDNVYASCRLRVFKPYGESLQRIVSYMADSYGDEPRRPFCIGTVRYASTRRRERLAAASNKQVDVPVEIDIADLVAHKTAVLGMTRKGKSNTNKVIATATYQYALENGLTIGQLIFDPAGEYANVNVQDGTALAQIGDDVVRYRLGATEDELAADTGLRSLALNFYDQDAVSVVWGLVGEFLLRLNNSQYVQSFVAADIEGPANPQARDEWRQVTHARRARMMVYACFIKAGLTPPAKFAMWVPLKLDLRNALVQADGRRGEDLSFLNTVQTSKRGDQVKLNAMQLLIVAEALAANYHSDSPNKHVQEWIDVPDQRVQHVVDVLLERKGGGYKVLLPLREGYHSPTASDDYAPAIHRDLVDGRIVIVDLSRGSEGVLQFASERVINLILHRAAERFRSNLPPHRIQIFLEEAHRLFDRDRFADRLAASDPYVRLAREAGKYKIGMVYSTQQVSSVELDVLDNTANWIVAHLNSETEVKLLRGRYEFDRFGDQIRHAEDVGFVRLKTQSSRFVIPIQVRLFDHAMVEAAKTAQPVVSFEEA
jgi:hypothetical protein